MKPTSTTDCFGCGVTFERAVGSRGRPQMYCVTCGESAPGRRGETKYSVKRYALLYGAKHRAKQKGLEFELDKEWLEKKLRAGVSELTGMPIVLDTHPKYQHHPNAPSLDRIDSFKGYTKENTMLVCYAENMMMNQFSMEVTRVFCRAILNATNGEYDGPCND